MQSSSRVLPQFQTLARRVRRRVLLLRWLRTLSATAPILLGVALVYFISQWLRGVEWSAWQTSCTLLGSWLTLTALWTWWNRPSELAALAFWDEHAGRGEMFASAYCFEKQQHRTPGEQLHLSVAAVRLAEDRGHLRRDLGARLGHRAWLCPLAVLAMALLLPAARPSVAAPSLNDGNRRQAEEVAKALENRPRFEPEDKQLSEQEQGQLRKLENELDRTVDKLQQLGDATERDVLAELEARAHEAEQLADALSGAGGKSLSSEMLAELERHADTSELAASLQAEDLGKAAAKAEQLARQLEEDDLSLEEQKRVEQALEESLAKANEQDEKSVVGEQLKKAHKGLRKKQPRQAAKEFEKLAEKLAQALQRQQLQKQLQQLARQLRNSNQQIFGKQPDLRTLAQQPPSTPPGTRQLGAQQLQALNNLGLQQRIGTGTPVALAQTPAPNAPQPGAGQALVPGAPPGQNPNAQQTPMAIPVPGTPGQTPGAAMPGAGQLAGSAPVPGAGQMPVPGGGQSPVPGSGQVPGAGQAAGAGQSGGAGQSAGAGQVQNGAAGSANAAGVGGLQAGHGTAAYGNTATKLGDASKTVGVRAQIGVEGPAQLRDIEGAQHREEVTRAKQAAATALLNSEEASLAEEPLPVSRRDQVLRYFTAIRRQLVEPPAENQSDQ